MGRIIANVKISNFVDLNSTIHCETLVDTGAANLVLPKVWRKKLGDIQTIRTVDCETATQEMVQGEIGGPVLIELEGFDKIVGEILFLDMKPSDGQYEPLLGYIILEQCQAAVDMLGHRLIHVKKTDLK